ncbi:hypothetical protein [Agarilytica rhodophyticola]|uniref:hypothetical protein n=1 Tax=Agarilytica rhodophyticola TaxID=1737490 RepID=UPI000B344047|nr:hypothetical protein [Agarilytica rhodophyticola]
MKIINRNKQQGAASIEYIVGSIFVLAALLMPVLPAEGGDGRTSAAEMLIAAIRENYQAYVWAMSIPI